VELESPLLLFESTGARAAGRSPTQETLLELVELGNSLALERDSKEDNREGGKGEYCESSQNTVCARVPLGRGGSGVCDGPSVDIRRFGWGEDERSREYGLENGIGGAMGAAGPEGPWYNTSGIRVSAIMSF
jgi:hypothetical protein